MCEVCQQKAREAVAQNPILKSIVQDAKRMLDKVVQAQVKASMDAEEFFLKAFTIVGIRLHQGEDMTLPLFVMDIALDYYWDEYREQHEAFQKAKLLAEVLGILSLEKIANDAVAEANAMENFQLFFNELGGGELDNGQPNAEA